MKAVAMALAITAIIGGCLLMVNDVDVDADIDVDVSSPTDEVVEKAMGLLCESGVVSPDSERWASSDTPIGSKTLQTVRVGKNDR